MVANTAVNLRKEPSISSLIIKVVKKGEVVSFNFFEKGWAQVSSSDNFTGYIDPRYLDTVVNHTINNEETKQDSDKPLDITVVINSVKELTRAINVYEEPLVVSAIVARIPAKNKVYLIEKITNKNGMTMIKIKFDGQILGYIKENDL